MTQETTPMQPAPEASVAVTAAPPAPLLQQKLIAETIGTFVLVFFGCGAVVSSSAWVGLNGNNRGAAFVTTVGLAFGLAIVVMVYAFGRVSGGHFNPAVSTGAAVSGRISWMEAAYYMAAQVIGAIVGAFVLWVIYHGIKGYDSTQFTIGANTFGDGGISWWGALLVELVLTAIFVMVILAVTDTRNEHPALAPLAIGLTLAAIHFVAIPLTGTSVNPARSIGPALFAGTGALKDLWVFIIAPLLGGLAAGLAYPALFGRTEEPVPGSGFRFTVPKRATAPAWSAPDQFQQQWNQQEGWAQQPAAQQPAAQQPAAQQGWGQPVPQHAAEGPAEQTQIKSQAWQQPVAPAAEGELPVYEQDGWRWDYGKQQWVPIEQGGEQPPAQH